VAKKKLTFIHLSSTTKIFLCPWAKLGPRAHHQKQQVAGKIIMNINIILRRSHLTWQFLLAKISWISKRNVKENIYTTKNSSSLTFTYKTANFDRMPDLINGGTSEGGTYFKLPRLCPYKEPSRIADYTYLHSKTYYYYYLLTYYVYYILLITLLLL